jgi:hypothetical protein
MWSARSRHPGSEPAPQGFGCGAVCKHPGEGVNPSGASFWQPGW